MSAGHLWWAQRTTRWAVDVDGSRIGPDGARTVAPALDVIADAEIVTTDPIATAAAGRDLRAASDVVAGIARRGLADETGGGGHAA
ncbi:hypothetical protein [Jiangella muralis]|uniref:hypothetical protein n=1 Tax=Jiangella muralis TaxID=702383 RepID=UPI00069D35CE|nr:hypothetical protein [Jiangella muralis]